MSVMNRYPLWKNLLVVIVTAAGLLFALPNLYGEDPSVQVSIKGAAVTADDEHKVEGALKAANLAFTTAAMEDKTLVVRFPDTDTQLHGLDVIRQTMGANYTAAMNLAPRRSLAMRCSLAWAAAFRSTSS